MKELNLASVEEVSGGGWMLVAFVLDAVIDFANGVKDGFNSK